MRLILSLCILMMLNVSTATANSGGIYLGKTRVIYVQDDKVASLSVHNTSAEQLWLLRSWLSDYIDDSKDGIPFLITPPLLRFEPKSVVQLRINATELTTLPSDRESIYRVNVLAIPPTAEMGEEVVGKSNNKGSIQFAVNNRIKFIYRPVSIASKQEVAKSYQKLVFNNQGNSLKVTNPTPYYATIGALTINGKEYKNNSVELLVAPFSDLSLPIDMQVTKVGYQLVDDHGGMTPVVIYSM